MHLSWSHKLFLRINALVGKRPWLDTVMYFCARWLLYVLGVAALVVIMIQTSPWWPFSFMVLGSLLFTGYLLSLALGILWPHPRPATELPQVKTLVHTLGTWKSFPSDHTLFSFLIAFFILFIYPVVGSIFLLAAALVGSARVYVGVHYPRDILGGLVLAILVVCGYAALLVVGLGFSDM